MEERIVYGTFFDYLKHMTEKANALGVSNSSQVNTKDDSSSPGDL